MMLLCWLSGVFAALPAAAEPTPPTASSRASTPRTASTRAATSRKDAPRTDAERIAAWIDEGRVADALRAIRAAEFSLSQFDRQMLTGRACAALRRFRPAQEAFEAALRVQPASIEARYQLGLAHEAAGNHALAIAQFEKAAYGGLDHADLHAAWARAYLSSGVVLGDLRTLRTSQAVQPGDRIGESGVVIRWSPEDSGQCVIAGRDTAIFHACRAVALEPRQGAHVLLLADTWAAGGLKAQAAAAYGRAAALLPEASRGACLERWAECLLALRDYDGYFERLREWMALPGGPSAAQLADAYARAAQAMRDAGDSARQIRYLTFAVELQPQACERRLALGDALSWAGRFADAAEQWRIVLRQKPDHPRAAELRRMLREMDDAASTEPTGAQP